MTNNEWRPKGLSRFSQAYILKWEQEHERAERLIGEFHIKNLERLAIECETIKRSAITLSALLGILSFDPMKDILTGAGGSPSADDNDLLNINCII
jgi:hypothetical protein